MRTHARLGGSDDDGLEAAAVAEAKRYDAVEEAASPDGDWRSV